MAIKAASTKRAISEASRITRGENRSGIVPPKEHKQGEWNPLQCQDNAQGQGVTG